MIDWVRSLEKLQVEIVQNDLEVYTVLVKNEDCLWSSDYKNEVRKGNLGEVLKTAVELEQNPFVLPNPINHRKDSICYQYFGHLCVPEKPKLKLTHRDNMVIQMTESLVYGSRDTYVMVKGYIPRGSKLVKRDGLLCADKFVPEIISLNLGKYTALYSELLDDLNRIYI